MHLAKDKRKSDREVSVFSYPRKQLKYFFKKTIMIDTKT